MYKEVLVASFSFSISSFLNIILSLVKHSSGAFGRVVRFIDGLTTATMQFKATAALAVVAIASFAHQAQAQGAYLESIRQSGNWQETTLKGETKPAEETIDIPKDGPFIKSFNGTNFTEIMKFAETNKVAMPYIISNPSPLKGKGEGMCIISGPSNLKAGSSVSFRREDTNGMLYVPQNTSALS
jgi:hypothetical protein